MPTTLNDIFSTFFRFRAFTERTHWFTDTGNAAFGEDFKTIEDLQHLATLDDDDMAIAVRLRAMAHAFIQESTPTSRSACTMQWASTLYTLLFRPVPHDSCIPHWNCGPS